MAEIDEERHVCDAAVTLAFSVLGKRWNGMIVSSLGGGPSTFVSLRRAVSGISDTVLSDRLAELAEAGLVARAVDAGPPVTVSYSLTESGRGLLPILDQLGTWASANLEIRAP
ncbi:helix-turn-helix domain-containing protein [Microbacterium sp. APC 3901]|uniref:winged helix-turn-helix transcriptional regulator n=1 Tax=Microbacterium sp. APC 3901 TaxID=3035192 RepID=UPI0025B58FAB|nr:helix-turn-helix domain-containing protein [Microbacterium sp. APC 3901]MDN3444385.1 helix-turn-helix domain-containing protein [Microbacterium sp. APC 3901]